MSDYITPAQAGWDLYTNLIREYASLENLLAPYNGTYHPPITLDDRAVYQQPTSPTFRTLS